MSYSKIVVNFGYDPNFIVIVFQNRSSKLGLA